MKRVILCSLIALFSTATFGQQPKRSSSLYVMALKKVTDVMVEDAISPVAASRYYAYTCLAANEVVNGNTGSSFTGVIKGLSIDRSGLQQPTDVNLESIYALYFMGSQLLPSGYRLSDQVSGFEEMHVSKGIERKIVQNAIHNAEKICLQVLQFSKADNFSKLSGYTKYTPLESDAYWKPTAPVFMQAVEPHWGKVRPLLIDSASQFRPGACIPYDSARASEFYKGLSDIYQSSNKLTKEEQAIAMFWDCNPFAVQQIGHVEFGMKKISPGGHWIGITGIASLKRKLPLEKTVWVHAAVSTALMDAFISCWYEKFSSNRVRPETAIKLLIDPKWKPLLQTPPFPEYTSGHSVISNAAAEVLTAFFGDNFSFKDNTEEEFGLPAREFGSFRMAAGEAAISRYYGGIHFKDAIEEGSAQGRKIGAFIVQKLAISASQVKLSATH